MQKHNLRGLIRLKIYDCCRISGYYKDCSLILESQEVIYSPFHLKSSIYAQYILLRRSKKQKMKRKTDKSIEQESIAGQNHYAYRATVSTILKRRRRRKH